MFVNEAMQFGKKKYNDLEKPAESVFVIVMKKRQQAFQHRIPHLANSHAKRPSPYYDRDTFKSHYKQRVSKYEKPFVCKQDERRLR